MTVIQIHMSQFQDGRTILFIWFDSLKAHYGKWVNSDIIFQTSKCELWPVYVPEDVLVAIQGKRRTRIDAHQTYMVQKFYCPSCEQYFPSIDEYHIHRILVSLI